MRRRLGLTAAAALLALLAFLLPGASPRAQEEQDLETLRQQIESGKAAEARIAGEIAAAIQEQDDVAEKLAAIARSIQAQEAVVGESEAPACSGWSRTRRPPWWSAPTTSSRP